MIRKLAALSLLSLFIFAPLFALDATQEEQASPASIVEISNSKFCLAIEEREPVNANNSFSSENNVIYYWTEVKTSQPPTSISHVWKFGGKVVFQIPLTINFERTRTWSQKTLPPELKGIWTVETLDANGTSVKSETFDYGTEPAPEQQQAQQ